jgi:hypothetical protein
MAGTFPSIRHPDYPFGEKYVERKVLSRFESGHELGRVTSTVGKMEFRLKWSALPESEFQTLKTFFKTQRTATFDWTHPIDSVTYTVRIPSGDFDSEVAYHGYRKVDLLLHEVP